MKTNDLVSIIVPVYGVEAYLPECVDSLLAQTHKDLEIILVDDESPDRCGEICDTYARQDCRVKVIHKRNGGAASARNAGLDAATGEYICFVDSDDVVAPDYVRNLYENLLNAQADIAVCGFSLLTKCSNDRQTMEAPGTYSRTEYLTLFLRHWTCSLLWNKIYRRSVIGALRLTEGHRIDDEFFTYKTVLRSKKIVVFEDASYFYRLRKSSVMRSDSRYLEKMLMDKVEYLSERYAVVAEAEPSVADAFLDHLLDSFVIIGRQCHNTSQPNKAIRAWLRQNWRTVVCSGVYWKRKILYLVQILAASRNSQQKSHAADNPVDYFP